LRQSTQRLYRLPTSQTLYRRQTTISLITAVLITIWLLILGRYAVLWGLLTFVLTFVPNIGPFWRWLGAFTGLIQLGLTKALLVAAGWRHLRRLGNLLELLMLDSMGLSAWWYFSPDILELGAGIGGHAAERSADDGR
jgi:predicted PurR-regulated permease PerM